jgi:NAD(P)-dependent dehydrogenase (short-subunit alcohol dehydrogenase family)
MQSPRDSHMTPSGASAASVRDPNYGEDSYRDSGRLEGRKALITGGDSGIGRAVALAFAREGASVVISHLPDEQPDADDTVRVVNTRAARPFRPGDLTDESYCREIVERTVRELGGIDILVNNAAYQMAREGLEEISAEELDHTFRTNILAMFHTRKAALRHMRPGRRSSTPPQSRRISPRPRCWPTRRRRRRSSTSPKASRRR